MQYYSQIYSMLFIDQMGHTIKLNSFPKRIVSLVPSQSELLWDLGLQNELVGITKFCIHPAEMYKTVSRVGGTKTLNVEKIRALKPDLIIGNKEENEQNQILQLQKEFNVWMSDIYNLNDSLAAIKGIGEITNKYKVASLISDNILSSFKNIKPHNKTVLYLIWKNPYMAAGCTTFIGDMLKKNNLVNVLPDDSRYPQLTNQEIQKLNPELIFLSSEPYPFKDKHIEELKELLPSSNVILVDGELFSWYGSRLAKSAAYFNTLSSKLA